MNLATNCVEREIVTTRILKFEIGAVYLAMTKPEQLSQWWGPNGFRNTFHHFDLKPDGAWAFVMHGPDGRDYENRCVFVRIEPQHCIHWKRETAPHFEGVVELDRLKDRTKVTLRMIFEDATTCQAVKSYCLVPNEENLDRLEAFLNSQK